ncbi:gamma-glutamylcyclotransferase (GGCT)/AIG2-like uncharacterized protein YtfP [Salirhabdus euzebyi]|uniref:Gamma-glutamylcyclotransferase (GGCT)/AIG2-like uncharacterized protein YtfP n=1 Tax=Salirhabdus euzebyi TaxID=394506 RepID=A0A841PUY4_9BACI|nr:gamma-glutamylcyclotransferase family protein [Salirhabdus euzebyi]MBB6452679.1 gamma-glutamylcyclotransferase (GGCT)/AIG2-like uncharacterized protein YtfP [Salirhabdus euzebyi]
MSPTWKVFVYGTLRKNESNAHYVEDALCIAKQAWTYGKLFDTDLGYPAMITSNKEKVYGEVYEVDANQLEKLDWLEGYKGDGERNDYERITQTIYTDNDNYEALVYIYEPKKVRTKVEISFGDWKCYRLLNQDTHLYFAYGSCMDTERFKIAGVDHLFHNLKGCGILKGYALEYRRKSHDGGRADIVESINKVEGKVYEVDSKAVRYLFRREGVDAGIYRPAFIEVEMDGKVYEDVLTFIVINKDEEVAPPEHYATEILRGAKGIVSEAYYDSLKSNLRDKFRMDPAARLEE